MPSPEPDHYAILGVIRTATEAEIRSAYRRLARESHPDANPDPEAEVRMRRINEAWETLRDPQKRSLYNRQLPGAVRVAVRTVRRQPPAQSRQRPQSEWFAQEDAPRAEARATAEYSGDATINWYKELGVREDAPRQEILKTLSRMAATLNGADVSATEFTRRRTTMREAWAVLGDQYQRAAYDRARKVQNHSPDRQESQSPEDDSLALNPKSKIQNQKSYHPSGYRLGPVVVNGFTVDRAASLGAVDLRGADLRGLDLVGIDLSGARLQGVDFEGASLRRANLSGADFSGSNLRFADLSNADCSAAVARQADLHCAALHGTNLFRANLSGARLTEAVGPGINLDYADLARTDFTGAKITPQLIERGRLHETIMPDASVATG